jgi:predicted RNA methylase
MPQAYVLKIEDIFGTHLELIRRIAEPNSQSQPHITVRYVDVLSNNDFSAYIEKRVSKIEITGAGSFGLESESSQKNKTVFLECEAEELERLVHKPHFPDSVFHITLYDGTSRTLAESMVHILEKYSWEFELVFVELLALTKIEINSGNKKKITIEYSDNVKALYIELFKEPMSREVLIALNEDEIVNKLEKVIESAGIHAAKYKKISKNPEQQSFVLEPQISDKKIVSSPNGRWSKSDKASHNKSGLFLTPPELASSIVEYALTLHKDLKVDFGDPAAGTGVFFGALDNLQISKGFEINSAIGIELDEHRAWQTEKKWGKRGLKIINGDYLHLEKEQKRSLVIANPPYVRFQNIPERYSKDLRLKASLVLNDHISGHAGLFVYFILFSHVWMKKKAIAAWLIPSEFMETNYGSALRKYFSKNVRLIRIHRFHERDLQFENAMVTSSVVFFENEKPSSEDVCEFTYGGSISTPAKKQYVKVCELDYRQKWKYHSEIKFAPTESLRLGEIFNIKRGIATGANNYFIQDIEGVEKYNIPSELLLPIIAKARGLEHEVILSDGNGIPSNVKNSFVISTALSREELDKKYPEMAEYLALGDELGVFDGYLVRKRKHKFLQELRTPPPFLCTYMGRSIDGKPAVKFIRNKSHAISTNSFNLLYPKEEIFGKECPESTLDMLYETVLKKVGFEQIEEVTRTYSGGLKKVEPQDLKNVKVLEGLEWFTDLIKKKLI